MKQNLLKSFRLRVGMLAALMLTALAGTAWAQSNYSTDYTGNVTLSTDGGTNASECDITISSNTYDGIKAGTSKKSAAVIMTVPSGTKYLHVHVAAWNGESSTTLSVSPSTNASPSSFILVPDAGIQGSSTSYTLNSVILSSLEVFIIKKRYIIKKESILLFIFSIITLYRLFLFIYYYKYFIYLV